MVVSDFLNKEKVLYFLATNYCSLHKKGWESGFRVASRGKRELMQLTKGSWDKQRNNSK